MADSWEFFCLNTLEILLGDHLEACMFTTEMDRFACELCHPTKQNISRFNLNT